MSQEKKPLSNVKRLMISRYPRFAQEIANANLQFRSDLPYRTAATDGKNIYFDPEFFASLSDDDKLFIIAHELMHIKFEHMYRMTQKNGELRDPEVWNIATDAIINANLKRDGFKIKEGYVDIPEALKYSAEEFYEKLLKEKQEKQKQQEQQKQKQQENKNGKDQKQDQNEEPQDQNNQQHQQDSNSQQGQNEESQDQNNQQHQQDQNNKQGQNKKSQDPNNQQGQNKKSQDPNNQQGQNNENKDGQEAEGLMMDDHSLWEEAFKESQKQTSSKNGQQKNGKTQGKQEIKAQVVEYNEKNEFQENRIERREIAKQKMETLKNGELKKSGGGNIKFGSVGEERAVLDWKQILKREFDKEETVWSQRRSIAENNYAYRLEEYEHDDEAITEVLIDVSGSVSYNMVRSFLRQLKPLLKNSKLMVACFDDEFYGYKEIKTNNDIDNFASYGGGGTNFDMALKHFSKDPKVNKIMFTDGCDDVSNNDYNKSIKNLYWIIYDNKEFNACCGKIVNVSSEAIRNISLKNNNKNNQDELSL